MPIVQDDLGVFYSTDFATRLHRLAAGVPQQPGFLAIMGLADTETLQGYVVGTVREIRYPTAAITLKAGDTLTDGQQTWRVLRDPRLVVDGTESSCHLTPAQAPA